MLKLILLSVLVSYTQNNFAVSAKISPLSKNHKNQKLNTPKSLPITKAQAELKDLITSHEQKELLENYLLKSSKKDLLALKAKTLKLANKAVPVLITVMKGKEYPDASRWIATFMLGRIMGRKSAHYIAKYAEHPNWMLRVAALKVLVALDQKQMLKVFSKSLKDKSMMVRVQALDCIKRLNLSSLAPHVWAMLYDQSNYSMEKGKRKRTDVIKHAIRTIGHLGYAEPKNKLLTMIKSNKYKDIFTDLDWTLSKISKLKSPNGNEDAKRTFWSKI